MSKWVAKVSFAIVLYLCACCAIEAQETRRVVVNPEPAYPILAKRMNLTGVVKVEVTIGTDGQIKDTKVLGGHPILVDAALGALRNWRYEKAASETKVQLEFKFHS
jgi:TonB family protein